MFWFFAIIAFISIVALIVSSICLATDTNPFGLWITIFTISGVLLFISQIGGSLYTEEENTTTQEECIEDEYQYNYCPYCGNEIK